MVCIVKIFFKIQYSITCVKISVLKHVEDRTGQYFVGRLYRMILYCGLSTCNGLPFTTTTPPYEPYTAP